MRGTRQPSIWIRTQFHRVTWYIAGATVCLLIIALLQHRAALGDAKERIARAEDQAFRENLRNRLQGERFPKDGLEGVSVPIGATWVAWIVDPFGCSSCMGEVPRVNRAILPEYPEVLVFVSGRERLEAERLATDWGLRTRVVADSDQRIRETLRLPFPSTFLIVNDQGRILHAEFHQGTENCRIDVIDLARRLATGDGSRSYPPLNNLTTTGEE